ncbi:MAG: ATP-dependent Clp protease adaptor ClpS [Saprospiraceae bacterium]|jgi:ATP-dependent Clp protease adaptor protein ClpS|nr:ATP-dependent Clp protease adaptor ClpS [Saprospiraceae bacterium]MBP9210172.1 ATP-dependent Clp protease adaptor ClpS [Saprospiraceae bacterium]MBV6473481.1 ATP-dependent Clp protease adapter protein ClpS [Saprospiraceae bacterium]
MPKSNPASWEALEEEVQLEDATGEIAELVLLNDEVNTFDWVIECLVDVCRHTFEQAEQLSLLVHFKGRAVVMTAGYDVLKPMKDALCERGLSAIIETIPV